VPASSIVLAELLDEEVEVRLVFVLRLLAELVGEDLVHEEIGDHGADLARAVDLGRTVRRLRLERLHDATKLVDQVRARALYAGAPSDVDRRHGLAGLCRLQGITNWSRPIIVQTHRRPAVLAIILPRREVVALRAILVPVRHEIGRLDLAHGAVSFRSRRLHDD
jgi:hypothetical protein